MLAELPVIPLWRLAVALLPAALVVVLLWRWSLGPGQAVYAMARMLVQLLLVGYVLTALFQTNNPLLVGLALLVMMLAASWIALRAAPDRSLMHYFKALAAIALGGCFTLLLVTQGVLTLEPWFEPRYVVPLAGMIFSNAMNTVGLAAERHASELSAGADSVNARNTALRAAMIPATNAMLAVGLVSIPGMMTGQVLAGVDPLIAARYQIMVMAMVYGSAGLSAGWYLMLLQRAGRTKCG